MDKTAHEIKLLVDKLQLIIHPEGGFYREVYRSEGIIPKAALPRDFSGDRNYSTAIYFLLTSDNFSAFHRIKQDELWHFYKGTTLYVHVIDQKGNYTRHEVGNNFESGELPQLTVRAGCWFASSVKGDNSYSLAGCTGVRL